jgi:predicted RNA-binding protein
MMMMIIKRREKIKGDDFSSDGKEMEGKTQKI